MTFKMKQSWLLICEKLELSSLCNLSEVSKYFNDIVKNDLVWKSKTLTDFGDILLDNHYHPWIEYYKAYYYNKIMLAKNKEFLHPFAIIDSVRRNDQSLLYYMEGKSPLLILKRGDMGYSKQNGIVTGYNFCLSVYDKSQNIPFNNTLKFLGKIDKRFAVPEFPPLYFQNSHLNSFYINIVYDKDQIVLLDTGFYHKKYPKYMFMTQSEDVELHRLSYDQTGMMSFKVRMTVNRHDDFHDILGYLIS